MPSNTLWTVIMPLGLVILIEAEFGIVILPEHHLKPVHLVVCLPVAAILMALLPLSVRARTFGRHQYLVALLGGGLCIPLVLLSVGVRLARRSVSRSVASRIDFKFI
jgi:hypothetical protein